MLSTSRTHASGNERRLERILGGMYSVLRDPRPDVVLHGRQHPRAGKVPVRQAQPRAVRVLAHPGSLAPSPCPGASARPTLRLTGYLSPFLRSLRSPEIAHRRS